MKRKRVYDEDEPSENAFIIPNFLPSPEAIARALKKSKITLLLDDKTIEYFKTHAKKHNASYQQMMREVLRHYTRHPKRAA